MGCGLSWFSGRIEVAVSALAVFFFSSRRRHTRWTGDWSSDVCSSDLEAATAGATVTLVTSRQPELFDEVRVVLRELRVILIGTMQVSWRNFFHQFGWRRGVASLAALLSFPLFDLSFFFFGLLFGCSFGGRRA